MPKALIITGYGINSEEELALAFNMTGTETNSIHINDIIDNPQTLDQYQILGFPGGFSYGDDTGSGNALANKIKNNLKEQVLAFAQKDRLVIGICNGFQILANLGLVPATNNQYGKTEVALMHNKQARLECRWVYLKNQSKKCIWTKDIDIIHIPIAHGEGNFYCEEDILKHLKENDQIAFRYTNPDGSLADNTFPFNPNGALEDIAGICDESGRILGMMPHPERSNFFVNEYGWEKKKEKLIREGKEIPEEGQGLQIFKNAFNYFK